jgi:hypothetical protein
VKFFLTYMIKKSPHILCNLEVHYRVHKRPPLARIHTKMNSVHVLSPHRRSILISFNGTCFSQVFQPIVCMHVSSLLCVPHVRPSNTKKSLLKRVFYQRYTRNAQSAHIPYLQWRVRHSRRMKRGVTQQGLFQFNLQYRYQLEGSLNDEILVHYSDPAAFKSSDIY